MTQTFTRPGLGPINITHGSTDSNGVETLVDWDRINWYRRPELDAFSRMAFAMADSNKSQAIYLSMNELDLVMDALDPESTDEHTHETAHRAEEITMTNTTTETTTIETNEIPTMQRANKITIQPKDGYMVADFYRTHKKLVTIADKETGFVVDPEATKTQQREAFRLFMIQHAADVGIDWDPADKRAEANIRSPKYTTSQVLMDDTCAMITQDVAGFIGKMPNSDKIDNYFLQVESITAMTKTAKGSDLSTMGITDGKYNSTGNWAWADIEVTVTMLVDKEANTEIYQTIAMQLVSGQLKKMRMTQTQWNLEVTKSLVEAGIVQPEAPTEPKPIDTKPEPSTDEPKDTKSGKPRASSRSAKAKGADKGKATVQRVIDKIEAENAKVGNI